MVQIWVGFVNGIRKRASFKILKTLTNMWSYKSPSCLTIWCSSMMTSHVQLELRLLLCKQLTNCSANSICIQKIMRIFQTWKNFMLITKVLLTSSCQASSTGDRPHWPWSWRTSSQLAAWNWPKISHCESYTGRYKK